MKSIKAYIKHNTFSYVIYHVKFKVRINVKLWKITLTDMTYC